MSRPLVKWSTAFCRFGLGARGRETPASGDPRAALEAELAAPDAAALRANDLPTNAQAMATFYVFNDRPKTAPAAMATAAAPSSPMAAPASPMAAPAPASAMSAPASPMSAAASSMTAAAPAMNGAAPAASPPNPLNETYQAETRARMEAGLAAKVGYVERLVAFWSNHFCVSVSKSGQLRILAGAFEREAIRPHVLGRFAEMAQAVESHPAMVMFLDQTQSVGPNSRAGQNGKRGLNENFAREILELHTLGVDGGYTQTDVSEFARMLTGWTVAGKDGKLAAPGTFGFNANAHEPGPRTLLGRVYSQPDIAQARAAIDDLARNPATSRHIARKFARAFVADAPSSGLVQRLADVFARTDGDLAALAHALIADEEAWGAPAVKLRDPWETVMASYRALGLDAAKPGQIHHALNLLGQPMWNPSGPNGFSDASDAWLSPEGMKMRVQIATGLARQSKDAPEPAALLERVLPDASSLTRETVLRAESPQQAYALLLLSPEFQRR